MSLIVGLTGGIATGKSTVSSYLREKGLPVVDADVASRKVVEPGSAGLAQVVDAFGVEVLQPDGSLDRQQLGALIFADESKRIMLNNILHPLIFQWMEDQVQQLQQEGHAIIVMDIPLLFESNYQERCDIVMVVYAAPDVQLERLKKRNGFSEAEAERRIQSQMSIEEKKEKAHILIDNSHDLAETYSQLDQWLAQVKNSL